MSNITPLSLLADYLPASDLESIEKQASKIASLPRVLSLGELKSPVAGEDPTELIRHRFLYRGGMCLLLGPTGIGKSALLVQIAIHFAAGKAIFGLNPGASLQTRGMRILIVQAENDEGDLAEMRDGVLAGCGLDQSEKEAVLARVRVSTINDRSGERFLAALDALLANSEPLDMVMVDPAFAYLGGDSNSQKDVSCFMREGFNPLVQKYQVGLILAHHTNKPPHGREKSSWAAGDFAYLGAGSSEWVNPARCALAVRSIGSDSVFELRAVKRGKRLRWKDDNGPTTMQYIAHSLEPGVIYWRNADQNEIDEVLVKPGNNRVQKTNAIEMLHCIGTHPEQNQSFYKERMSRAFQCSATACQNVLAQCIAKDWVESRKRGQQKLYCLTDEGKRLILETPSTVDWTDHPPASVFDHGGQSVSNYGSIR